MRQNLPKSISQLIDKIVEDEDRIIHERDTVLYILKEISAALLENGIAGSEWFKSPVEHYHSIRFSIDKPGLPCKMFIKYSSNNVVQLTTQIEEMYGILKHLLPENSGGLSLAENTGKLSISSDMEGSLTLAENMHVPAKPMTTKRMSMLPIILTTTNLIFIAMLLLL